MNEQIMDDTYDSLRLDNQVCFPLYACSKELIRKYRKPLEKLNLTYTQYVVMMVLWEKGALSEGEIGKIVHLDSGTLAPLLKRLEKQGYIQRIRPETNERMLMISLTDQGEILKEKALTIPCLMEGSLNLSKDEMAQLKALLTKAMTKMEKKNDN